MTELIAVTALAALVALAVHRLRVPHKWVSEEDDDALYKGSVQGLWFLVAVGAIALVAAWLLL